MGRKLKMCKKKKIKNVKFFQYCIFFKNKRPVLTPTTAWKIYLCLFQSWNLEFSHTLNFSRWLLKLDATCSSSKKLQFFWSDSKAANTSDRAGLWGCNSHVDIVFLVTSYFSATFDGFILDSTSVISLNFSVRDNLFLFTVAILSHKSNKRSWIKCVEFEFRITASELYIRKMPTIWTFKINFQTQK